MGFLWLSYGYPMVRVRVGFVIVRDLGGENGVKVLFLYLSERLLTIFLHMWDFFVILQSLKTIDN